jgi:hypothetical protein
MEEEAKLEFTSAPLEGLYRCRRFDSVFGRLGVCAPRFDGCRHCGERLIASPVSELLPERVSPKLRHLQAELAAQLPYRQAAALLEELLPKPAV